MYSKIKFRKPQYLIINRSFLQFAQLNFFVYIYYYNIHKIILRL